eukprot:865704-Prorocentrum_minimum.AAC.2
MLARGGLDWMLARGGLDWMLARGGLDLPASPVPMSPFGERLTPPAVSPARCFPCAAGAGAAVVVGARRAANRRGHAQLLLLLLRLPQGAQPVPHRLHLRPRRPQGAHRRRAGAALGSPACARSDGRF